MDFAHVILELWRRRWWVALGAGLAIALAIASTYRIASAPPFLEPRSLATGVADTQVLIDTPRSALTDLGKDFDPLAARASVFSRFMTSRPVREAIARRAGVEPSAIVTEAPLAANQPAAAREPTGPDRAKQILGETRGYRLRFFADQGQPTIVITAVAANARDAIRLANAGATGFSQYVASLQRRQEVPPRRRVQVRQLGEAEGGMVGGGINSRLALLVLIGVFVASCVVILLVSSVMDSLAQMRGRGTDAVATETG